MATKIKHYMRPTIAATNKEVVTEHVEVGSPTFTFLERMEDRRKKQECMLTVDMRGKVPYECKSYVHRNRVFWMDDISYAIFTKGLDKNHAVFTVGTYEEIINSSHTYKGMRAAEAAEKRPTSAKNVKKPRRKPVAATAQKKKKSKFRPQSPMPDIIPLGYFYERREKRLLHPTGIDLHVGDQTFSLKTRDISPHGLKVYAKHALPLIPDQEITITFTQFNEEYDAALDSSKYRVVAIEKGEAVHWFRLAQVDTGTNKTTVFLDEFINNTLRSTRGSRKLDHDDDQLTVHSQLAGLFYSTSTPLSPFFIEQDDQGIVKLASICKNANNESFMAIFKNGCGTHDFRCLTASHQTKRLYLPAKDAEQEDSLIAVYKTDSRDTPKLVGKFEFPSEMSWLAFLMERIDGCDLRVFKILSRPARRPSARKIRESVERLMDKSTQKAEDVILQAEGFVAAGALADITSQVREWDFSKAATDRQAVLDAASTAKKSSETAGDQPDVVQFGYVEQRHEDRYMVRLEAEFIVSKKAHKASTKDISVRGMCLEVDAMPENIYRGDQLLVSLPGINKRMELRDKLKDIPYEVTCVERRDKVLLHLKRVLNAKWQYYGEFFEDLIERNCGRIAVDLSDAITAARSGLYAAMTVEATATLPFFILKDPDSGERTVKVALPREPGSFAEFFEITPGIYDFSAITEVQRLFKMTGGLAKGESSEIVIYLYKKQIPNQACFEIYSATEFESAREKKGFLDEALKHDYCVVKTLVGPVRPPKDVEIHRVVDRLIDLAPYLVNKLKSEFHQVIAVGDIIDITHQALGMEEKRKDDSEC